MKKYTKLICMIAAVCLLGAAAFCGFRTYANSYGTISERIIQPLKVYFTQHPFRLCNRLLHKQHLIQHRRFPFVIHNFSDITFPLLNYLYPFFRFH